MQAIVDLVKNGKKPENDRGPRLLQHRRRARDRRARRTASRAIDTAAGTPTSAGAEPRITAAGWPDLPAARPPHPRLPTQIDRATTTTSDQPNLKTPALADHPRRACSTWPRSSSTARRPLSRIRNVLHRYPGAQPGHRPGHRRDRLRAAQRPVPAAPRTSRSSPSRSPSSARSPIAQTLIILTAGIDLSVGAVMVLSLDGDGAGVGNRPRLARPARPAPRPRRRCSPPARSTASWSPGSSCRRSSSRSARSTSSSR